MEPKMRVVLVDEFLLVRQGIRMMLQETNAIQIVGEASTGDDAISVSLCERPDALVMNVNLPGKTSATLATQEIISKLPNTRVLLLVGCYDEDFLRVMLMSGAAALISKRDPVTEIVRALKETRQSKMYLSAGIPEDMKTRFLTTPRERRGFQEPVLTQRELEVLELITLGYTNLAIAHHLNISIKTVEAHRAHIATRIGASSRAEFVRYAFLHGLPCR